MKNLTKSRIVLALAILITIIAVGILGLVLFWVYQPSNVLEVKNSPFPVRIVNDGDNKIVVMHINYCKNISKQGKVRVSYVSKSEEVFLPVADENGPKQCQETDIPIILPKDLKPDVYKIKFRATYDINPIKKDVVNEFESQSFDSTSLKAQP